MLGRWYSPARLFDHIPSGRSGNAANHVFKIVRVSPEGKKKLLLDARPNEFGNVVTVLTFEVGYHYDVRVKDVTTGESSRFRLEVPESTW